MEPQLEARGDSTYRCSYQPTMEGVHTVHVTFAGVPIPRSPYTVTIGQGRLVPATYVPHCWGLPWDGWLEGPTPALPTLGTRGLCFHCRGELSFLPRWGPSSCSSCPLHLSFSSRFHLRKNLLELLESCCSLLCPQGQRYLDLSSFGRGGLGGAGEQVGGGRHILVWATGPGVGVPFISLWHVLPDLLGPILRVPTLIQMAQPRGGKQGRGCPVPAPVAS